jgi:uncharacterized protein
MAVYFVDSSALVKRYINETGSQWILNLCNPASNHDIVIAAITGVEIIAAITRRATGGSIDSADAVALCHQFRIDLETEYQVIEISDRIICNEPSSSPRITRLRCSSTCSGMCRQ